ncbi:C-type lectin domain family 4 member G-like [Pelobates fuscus]|uniref:C-type lectin domain family 4 member G-like n=1 Tax=Pelobates fuscus TaxID=191477 RepID=UPI002FE463AF
MAPPDDFSSYSSEDYTAELMEGAAFRPEPDRNKKPTGDPVTADQIKIMLAELRKDLAADMAYFKEAIEGAAAKIAQLEARSKSGSETVSELQMLSETIDKEGCKQLKKLLLQINVKELMVHNHLIPERMNQGVGMQISMENVYGNVERFENEGDYRNCRVLQTDKEAVGKCIATVGENNSTPGRVTVILMVLLLIMFLFLIALTSLVFMFYYNASGEIKKSVSERMQQHFNVSEEISVLKKSLFERMQQDFNVSEEISVLKKSLFERMQQEIAQNNILSEVQSIKETLDKLCKTCPSGWRATGSSCYYLSSSTLSWDKARDECYKFNSALITFSSKNDMDTYNKLFTDSTKYWMGLRRDATNINMWKWLDGTELTFTNWDKGEPNNSEKKEHCGEILSGSWNDRNCDASVNFICRKVIC